GLTYHRWRTNVTLPSLGLAPYKYQEDNKGKLIQVVSPFNQTTNLQYDLDGKNYIVAFPTGALEVRSYLAPQDWLQQITLQKLNGMQVDQLTYSYVKSDGHFDPTGHIQSEMDLAHHLHAFSYDNRYQLKQESDSYPLTLMRTV